MICMIITHHIVGDSWKQKDRDDPVWDEISEDLGEEVNRSTVIAAGVLMSATGMNNKHMKSKAWDGLSYVKNHNILIAILRYNAKLKYLAFDILGFLFVNNEWIILTGILIWILKLSLPVL